MNQIVSWMYRYTPLIVSKYILKIPFFKTHEFNYLFPAMLQLELCSFEVTGAFQNTGKNTIYVKLNGTLNQNNYIEC